MQVGYFVTVKAYNGSYITTSASGASGNQWGANQTGIYAQLGYSLADIRSKNVTTATWNAGAKTYAFTGGSPNANAIAKTSYGLGIGSGAGYTEGGNGTYALVVEPLFPVQNPSVEYGAEGTTGDPHLNFVIRWDAPENAGAANPVEQYVVGETVYSSEGGDITATKPTINREADERFLANVEKGAAGFFYSYQIRAKNEISGENKENAVTFQITNPTVPAAASAFAVSGRPSGDEISFSWTKPAGEIGATGYYVYYIPTASRGDVNALARSELITGTEATIRLPEGRGTWDAYDFWVASVNETNADETLGAVKSGLSVSAGETVYSAWQAKIAAAYETVQVEQNVYRVGDLDITRVSNLVSGERALTEPTMPREVTAATNNVTQQVRIQWKAPADAGTENTGAAGIVAYRVYVQEHADESGALRDDVQVTTLVLSESNAVTQEGDVYTYVHAGLVDGRKYDVFVTALNGNAEASGEAESAAQKAADVATPRRVPDALSGLGAVSESSVSAQVTWNVPVKQANGHDETGGDPITGYTVTGWLKADPEAKTSVTFQTADGGATWTAGTTSGTGMTIGSLAVNEDGTLTASVSGLTAARDGGLPGNEYSFAVTATNGAGTGEAVSCEVTTLHAPSVVQDVTVVEDDRSVTLSWKTPEDSGTNGTNKVGAVKGYAISYKQTASGSDAYNWVFVPSTDKYYDAATDTWTYQLDYLNNGQQYDIWIYAFSGSAGWDEKLERIAHDDITGFLGAAEKQQATPRRVPYAPVIGEVKTGDGQATIVTITSPANQSSVEPGNGGDRITSYKLYAVPVTLEAGTKLTNQTMSQEAVDAVMAQIEAGTLTTAELHASKPVEEYGANERVKDLDNVQVPNLLNGGDRTTDLRTGNYIIFVRAENEAGEGKASNGVFVRVGMPLAPTGLVGSLGNRMEVAADYKAAVGNGTAIKSYVLWAGSKADASDAKIVNPGVDGLHSTFVAEENGNELWLFIQADNEVGLSPLSSGVQVTVGAPVTPRINAASSNNSAVTVQWTSGSNNGNQFDQFKVYYRQVHEDGTVDEAYTQAKTNDGEKLTGTKYDFSTATSGFVVGNRYLIYVTACNVAGESPYSEPYELTVGGAGKPEITELRSSDNTLTATIAPPSMQAGDELDHYNVYLNGSTTMYEHIVLSADKTTVEIRNLSNGLNYTVTVEAETKNGRGLMSDPVTGVPARKADQVTGVTAEPTSGRSIRVSWDPMSLSGGSAVTGYYITIYDKNGADQCAYYEVDGATVSSVELDNEVLGETVFASDTTYQVGVQAVTRINDTAVFGEQSAKATVKTFSLPAAPKITSVISDCTTEAYQTVTVTWEAPEVMGDAPITGYVLYTNDWAYNGPNGNSGFDYYPAEARSAELPNRVLDETLEYKLAAVNMVGEGEKSAGVTYKVGDPATPNITNVTLTNQGFKITWDAVGVGQPNYQVTHYKVYLTDTLEAPLGSSKAFQRVVDNNKASYTANIQVQPGQYYVWVSAENAFTEQPKLCASYVIVTVGGLEAPAGLTAVPGENTIQVSWNGLEDAAKYRVFYNDHVLEVTEPSAELNLSNGMIPGVEYQIRVAAVDADGNQGVTCDCVYTHAWGTPVTPVISDVTPVESTFHFVHSASSCVGVSEAVEYRYLMRLSGSENEYVQLLAGRDYQKDENGVITVSSIGGTALKQGEEYTLVVRAWYNDNVHIDSVPASVTCGQPYAPTITNATPGSESLSIAFEPNKFGPGATGFLVYVRDGEGHYYSTEGTDVGTTPKGYPVVSGYHAMTFNRLLNKQTYYVTMTAVNSAGESQMSNQVAVTPGTAIAPKIVNAVSGHGQVEISWLASSDTSVYQYNIYQDGVQVAQTGDTTIVIKNLKDGQQYRFQVTAVNNAGGESAKSETVILSPGGVPGPVSGVNWTLDEITPESQSAILYWNKPVEDGGLPLRYVVSGTGVPNGSVTVDAAMCKVTGLVKGTEYTYTVRAANDAGLSEAVTFTGQSAREPGAPAITSCVGVNGNISVTWNAPTDNGRSAVKGYNVLIDGKQVNDDIITAMEYHFPGNEDIPLVMDLAKSYTVQVCAVNGVGIGTPAQSTTSYYGMLAESAPNAPTITSVRARTSGKLNVEWAAPGYNGNNEITSYTLYYMEASAYTGSNLTSGTRLTFGKDVRSTELSGLTDGVEYVMAVMATNGKGDSPLSTPYTMAPKAYLTPNAPEIKSYSNNAGLTQMTITWEYTPKAGDDLKTDFKVFVGVGSAQASATVQDTEFISEDTATGTKTYQAVISGLNAGQSHYISVSATNYLGDYGENQFGTAQSTGIRARVNLNVVNQNGELTAVDADMNGEEDHKVTITGPSAPQSATVRSIGTEVTVTWVTPEEVGNGKDGFITKYVLVKNGLSIDLPLGKSTDGFTEGEDGSYAYSFAGEMNKGYTLEIYAVNNSDLVGTRTGSLFVFVSPSTPKPTGLRGELMSVSTEMSTMDLEPTDKTPTHGAANADFAVELNWNAPTTGEDGAPAKVAGYRLYVAGVEAQAVGDDPEALIDPNETSCVYGLSNNQLNRGPLSFRVSAWYGEGDEMTVIGHYDAAMVSTATETGVPAKIEVIELKEIEGGTKLNFSWNPDDAATNYKVYKNGMEYMTVPSGLTNLTLSAADLIEGSISIFQVSGVNGDNIEGEKSDAYSYYKPMSGEEESDLTAAKLGVPEVDKVAQSLNLTWDVVEGAEGYVVKFVKDGVSYTVDASNVTDTTLSIADYSAVVCAGEESIVDFSNAEFIIQVQPYKQKAAAAELEEALAEAELVYGPVSVVAVSTLTEVPDAPENFAAKAEENLTTAAEKAMVYLTWDAPVFQGGNGATVNGYTLMVYYMLPDDTEQRQETIPLSNVTSYEYEGKVNVDYSFVLTAHNDAVKSESEMVTASARTTAADVATVGAPTITGYLSNGSSLKILWNAPTVNPDDVWYYVVYVDGQRITDTKENPGQLWAIVQVASGVRDIEVRAISKDTIASEPAAIKARLALNMIDMGSLGEDADNALLIAATAPASSDPKDLDLDMDGAADATGGGEVKDTVLLKGTIAINSAAAGDVNLRIYADNDTEFTNALAETTVKWTNDTATQDFNFEAPKAVSGTYTLVISKDQCTSYIVTGIDLSKDAEKEISDAVLYVGDLTGDGQITSEDLAVIKINNLKEGTAAQGDLTGDGFVNSEDLAVVKVNYLKESKSISWDKI